MLKDNQPAIALMRAWFFKESQDREVPADTSSETPLLLEH